MVYIHVAADWADIFDKQTRENVSQTLLHAVAHRFQEKQNVAKRWACELESGVLVQLELTTECHLKFFYLLY